MRHSRAIPPFELPTLLPVGPSRAVFFRHSDRLEFECRARAGVARRCPGGLNLMRGVRKLVDVLCPKPHGTLFERRTGGGVKCRDSRRFDGLLNIPFVSHEQFADEDQRFDKIWTPWNFLAEITRRRSQGL